jgi:hypothetical protein
MTIRQNGWTLGAFCASYCRIVAGHHTLEDRSVFPHLRAADAELAAVIDRLEQEHEVIADLLERVDRAMLALVTDEDGGMAKAQAVMDLFTDALLSHLGYEERAGRAAGARGLLLSARVRGRLADREVHLATVDRGVEHLVVEHLGGGRVEVDPGAARLHRLVLRFGLARESYLQRRALGRLRAGGDAQAGLGLEPGSLRDRPHGLGGVLGHREHGVPPVFGVQVSVAARERTYAGSSTSCRRRPEGPRSSAAVTASPAITAPAPIVHASVKPALSACGAALPPAISDCVWSVAIVPRTATPIAARSAATR